jgi:hypothetical protein
MGKYQLASTPFPALNTGDVRHGGTGAINSAKNLVEPWTVARDVNTQLGFQFIKYSIKVMSFEISTQEAPNWFGVSFRNGIISFDKVNIFFHPNPGGAGMTDHDYPTRSGNWPKLFRYAEMFGSQMAAAECDQITVVPFFNNSSWGGTLGLFPANWKDIVEDILNAVRTEALQLSSSDTVVLKDVVLSDFSAGRSRMQTMRARAPSLGSYLREIWDFDGVGGVPPHTAGGVRAIIYDQHAARDPHIFHVPPQRWLGFHHKLVASVHSNIPDMLAWHAATVSSVCK